MNAEYYKVLAGHMAFIKKAHVREMRKIEQALTNPAPVICACCRKKMAEKHRVMPNQRASLRLVK
jgi:uncharacterized CHY-type Zn-finger protein